MLISKTLLDTLSSQSWCTTGQTLQYELMYYNPAAGLISDGLSFFVPPLDSSSYYPTLAELWWLCAFPLARHFWKNANTFSRKNPPLCDSKFHPNWQNYGKSMAVCLSVHHRFCSIWVTVLDLFMAPARPPTQQRLGGRVVDTCVWNRPSLTTFHVARP